MAPPLNYTELNSSQKRAMAALIVEDRNVMILGEAGTGKSAFIWHGCKMYIDKCVRKGKSCSGTLITAPCGMAASKLKGRTLDSVIPPLTNVTDPHVCATLVKKLLATNAERWKFIKLLSILVIDEVSTLLATKLKMLDVAFRIIREAPQSYMGGVRVMLCGDFLQLDAVGDAETTKLFRDEAMLLGEFKVVCLEENLRQSDQHLSALLSRARVGRLTSDDNELLLSKSSKHRGEEIESNALHICGSRNLAHAINTKRFESLQDVSGSHKFEAVKRWTHGSGDGEWIVKSIDEETPSDLGTLGERLRDFCSRPCVKDAKNCTLRIGTRVMLNRNLYEYKDNRMRNGRLGTVTEIGNLAEQYGDEPVLSPFTHVIVAFDDDEPGVTVKVAPAVLRHGVATGVCEVWCMPLVHAWAITVHKAQGCEVDRLVVHCADLYRPKQLYVAISRCRTLNGLTLLNYEGSLLCPPAAMDVKFYDAIVRNGGTWDFRDGHPGDNEERCGASDKKARRIKAKVVPLNKEARPCTSAGGAKRSKKRKRAHKDRRVNGKRKVEEREGM
ncbi:hypothetical protein CYMTET_47748 [Cymbomonas tetramitiformis]|uniref:ATP-dependent DNA helicase n=1 Tax=Cymbomonas tetramitiformis TaxID=36881 RepID=A0AAE0EWC0_9CHLO|nr:hypothetical protein CYMTET_47748 [Cymbomonas tetramitiformis]|eukprot:gene376-707_t